MSVVRGSGIATDRLLSNQVSVVIGLLFGARNSLADRRNRSGWLVSTFNRLELNSWRCATPELNADTCRWRIFFLLKHSERVPPEYRNGSSRDNVCGTGHGD